MPSVREIKFGEQVKPLQQFRLRAVKGEPTQQRWLLVACRDKDFDLSTAYLNDDGKFIVTLCYESVSYGDFWASIATLKLDGNKWWLIGWRVRYACDRAGFVEALDGGTVKLPRIKVGKNKGKHGGKLTWTGRVFEVDAIVGSHKLKLLDLSNFGIELDAYADRLEDVNYAAVADAVAELLQMSSAIGISICKSTAAQLGWYRCRQIGLTADVHVNMSAQCRELERRAYFGGRCEPFKLGDIPGTTYSLDVKSCYAHVCKEYPLPYRCIAEFPCGCEVGHLLELASAQWIADVVIDTDSPDYPVRWDGKVIYPIGKFSTSLCWPELQHAINLGRVRRVMRAQAYQASRWLADYATWYALARGVNRPLYSERMGGAVKAIFNSSLGYTAREKYEWIPWDSQIGFKYWLGVAASPEDRRSIVSAQVLDSERRWLRVAGEPREAMPFLHATICSWARVLLLRIFAVAGRENILYCDTDGILVNRAGREALERDREITGRSPGQLIERFTPGSARIQGQKSYRIGKQWIQSGVVKTRYSKFAERRLLVSETGRSDSHGNVSPFQLDCIVGPGGIETCRNHMA